MLINNFNKSRFATGTIIAAMIVAIAGCREYRERQDSITMGLGNANAHNIAVQTVDPWPPNVGNADIHIDGERSAIAIKRYKKNKSIEPEGLATQNVNTEKSN